MEFADVPFQPRAKRKTASDKENAPSNTLMAHVKPGVRMADAPGPVKKLKVAEGPRQKAEPELRVALFFFLSETEVEELVDGEKINKTVSAIKVQLEHRPLFKRDSKYIILTQREQSLVVALFNSARSSGCGVNETVAGIKKVHPIFKKVGKASVYRWIENEKKPQAARGGKSGRPKLISDQQRDAIKKEVRLLSSQCAYGYDLAAVPPAGRACAVVSAAQLFANPRRHPAAGPRAGLPLAHLNSPQIRLIHADSGSHRHERADGRQPRRCRHACLAGRKLPRAPSLRKRRRLQGWPHLVSRNSERDEPEPSQVHHTSGQASRGLGVPGPALGPPGAAPQQACACAFGFLLCK